MELRKIITQPVETVGPDTSIRAIATKMRDLRIGALPVVHGERVIGIVTDRDIVTRLLPDLELVDGVTAAQIMSDVVRHCYLDQEIEEAAAIMGDYQIRRLLVLDHDQRLVGIVSLGDIAEDASERIAGEILGEVVEER
ncbi:MAG: CBS domain-containing protein [Paracoccaceae bacterium]